MVLLGDSDINLKGLRSKKKKMVDNSDWRPWLELPEVLLYLITKWLGTIDHLMFGCAANTEVVCCVIQARVYGIPTSTCYFYVKPFQESLLLP